MDLITRLYQIFDPAEPLKADAEGDALYVNWQAELNLDDIKPRIANAVTLSSGAPLTRLLTGHRGVGKTTELNRIKRDLERKGVFVSLLMAEEWVDLQEVSAPEIVFQVVRQLVSDLRDAGYPAGWTRFTEFFREFADLLRTEVELKDIDIGGDPVKFSIVLKDVQSARPILRALLERRLPTIYQLINDVVLTGAREWLAKRGITDILIVVDQLDRIPQEVINDRGLTNHENLYLDSAGILKRLECDIVYTAPIELAFSKCRGRLQTQYGQLLVMPAIPVVQRTGDAIGSLRKIVDQRLIREGATVADLVSSEDGLDRFCRYSGGHVVSLFHFIRTAIERQGQLPLGTEAIEATLRTWAYDISDSLRAHEWEAVRQVHSSRQHLDEEEQDETWNMLLREMLVIPYRDRKGAYYDWNPLLEIVETERSL